MAKKKKKKKKQTAGVMAKWGKMKWQCTSEKIMPIENDLTLKSSVNDKNKKEAQTVSFSYVPHLETGANVRTEVNRWSSLVGKVNPLYIGTKRFGPKKLKLKSASATDIVVQGVGTMTSAGIALEFEQKKKATKKTSKKKSGTTSKAKKTTKKKAKSK